MEKEINNLIKAKNMKQKDPIDEVINQIKVNKTKDGSGHFLKCTNKPNVLEHIIYGVFDGQNMYANDSKTYPVPCNYASKSQLVEGDKMKLIITPEGEFIYKQIGLANRKRFIGRIMTNGNDFFAVDDAGHRFHIIRSSVTFFKLKGNDEVVAIIPRDCPSVWCAIENVICKK